jgi:phosphoserine phosphatase RsbU/P
MYTDGITETENPQREFWGLPRLEALLHACRNYTPAQIANCIEEELQAFRGDGSQSDDVTLVVVGVNDSGKIPGRAAAS